MIVLWSARSLVTVPVRSWDLCCGVGVVCLLAGVALGEACTIVLRGASSHILEEADRSLHDALCVLSETVSRAAPQALCTQQKLKVAVATLTLQLAYVLLERLGKAQSGCKLLG